jgi:hypothetical protein
VLSPVSSGPIKILHFCGVVWSIILPTSLCFLICNKGLVRVWKWGKGHKNAKKRELDITKLYKGFVGISWLQNHELANSLELQKLFKLQKIITFEIGKYSRTLNCKMLYRNVFFSELMFILVKLLTSRVGYVAGMHKSYMFNKWRHTLLSFR